jgi:ABC-type uncharacterized transport system ATPase subunit
VKDSDMEQEKITKILKETAESIQKVIIDNDLHFIKTLIKHEGSFADGRTTITVEYKAKK